MKTPLQKANEITINYLDIVDGSISSEIFRKYQGPKTFKSLLEFAKKERAKQCALVYVNDLLNSPFLEPQPKRYLLNGNEPHITHLEYWFKVKKYIENF